MILPAWMLLAALGQERFILRPDDANSIVRLTVSVPEPLDRAGVHLDLHLPDGMPIETEPPRLLRQRGWLLARENSLVRLSRTEDPHPETPGLLWRWRPRGGAPWHEDQWSDLTGPVPLAVRERPPAHGRWRWGWIVAEGLVAVGLMAGLLQWLRFRHPANRLRRAMMFVDPGEPAWATLHEHVRDYLTGCWNLAGRAPVRNWHLKRLDPDLGRRLEHLMEASQAARHGTVAVEPAPLVEAWCRWLTDAEEYRMRRS